MKKNKIILTTLLVLIISSCSIHRKIGIYEKRKSEDLKLVIDMNTLKYDFGVSFFIPIILTVSAGETIYELKIEDQDKGLIWEIASKKNDGFSIVAYGELKRPYIQLYPLNNQKPEELIIGDTYKVFIKTEELYFEKTIIYQAGETYITKSDIVP